jgi:hypothetical protein
MNQRMVLSVAAASALTVPLLWAAPASAATGPTVAHVGQIAAQNVAPQPGSEPDTLVEPDIAVSPLNKDVAVAASHDGRFPDGGAVAILYASTSDGGRTWQSSAVPDLTVATGGVWDRASDPVVAFGPDGSVYISTLVFDLGCPSGVAVSRSIDGGRTFAAPVLVNDSQDCAFSDDKNWLVVDTSATSTHPGRLYQFWTAFLTNPDGTSGGSPQVVSWSDDRGQTWSPYVAVSAPHANTQNSQPVLKADGAITDTYLDFGAGGSAEGPEHHVKGQAATTAATTTATTTAATTTTNKLTGSTPLVATTSRDGGRTWTPQVLVTTDVGDGPKGVRCCLDSVTQDPTTGRFYAAWDSADPSRVRMSSSSDGATWSAPVTVNSDTSAALDHVNVDVSAFGGSVYVSYGTRDIKVANGRYVQQQLSTSSDGGATFGAAQNLGPLSDLKYAAFAGGDFPGDYAGSAATAGRLYVAWCRSSQPVDKSAKYHQVLDAATLNT